MGDQPPSGAAPASCPGGVLPRLEGVHAPVIAAAQQPVSSSPWLHVPALSQTEQPFPPLSRPATATTCGCLIQPPHPRSAHSTHLISTTRSLRGMVEQGRMNPACSQGRGVGQRGMARRAASERSMAAHMSVCTPRRFV